MCKGCIWNRGWTKMENNFGIKEPYRICWYFGYFPMWRVKKGICKGKQANFNGG